jgi:type IV secretory pathway VirB4 component
LKIIITNLKKLKKFKMKKTLYFYKRKLKGRKKKTLFFWEKNTFFNRLPNARRQIKG